MFPTAMPGMPQLGNKFTPKHVAEAAKAFGNNDYNVPKLLASSAIASPEVVAVNRKVSTNAAQLATKIELFTITRD